MKLRIGSRPSKLALLQVKEIMSNFSDLDYEIYEINTKGDIDKSTPLTDNVGDDFFTYDIEQELIKKNIDLAIHSAKDLEQIPPKELLIAATTRSISPFECLVSKNNAKLKDLPKGAVIGTSSIKRKAAIMQFRKDIIVKDIRGNVDNRIKQLDDGLFDGIIVAHAALIRLGYESRISEIISTEIMRPHILQGRLAVQIHKDRKDLLSIFRGIDEK